MSAEPSLPVFAGDGLDELFAKAIRPVAVEVRVDPVTLDRLFTMHFEEHPPLHVAVGSVELAVILSDLTRVAASALN